MKCNEKNIVIVAEHTSFPQEPGYNRFRYIAELIASQDHCNVLVISSKFNHYTKSFRTISNYPIETYPYDVKFVDDISYEKNVCIKRFKSQYLFAKHALEVIKALPYKPDCIFIGMPPLEGVNKIGKYANKHGIRFIIDVNDLWPEAMKTIIDIPLISDILFLPMKIQADKGYRYADAITATSKENLDRALEVNKKSKQNEFIYIGTFMKEFSNGAKKYAQNIKKQPDEFWLIYIGTLGVSYDFNTVFQSLKKLLEKGCHNIKLNILGRGPLENDLKNQARQLGIPVNFLGYLEYGHMAAYVQQSDIGLNPLKKSAAQVVINKVGDYLAGGLPIVNGCSSKEMSKLIEDHVIGLNYEPENCDDLSGCIERLYHDKEFHNMCSNNCINVAETKFDRETSYIKFIDIILNR